MRALGRQQAGERAHEGGLAGAVGADERGQFAGLETERGALDDAVAAKPHRRHRTRAAHHDGAPSSRRRSRKDHGEKERYADQRGDDADAELVRRAATMPHRDVGGGQQRRARERARQQHARRIGADRAAHEMRRDQPDEADGAGDRHRRSDAERNADHHRQAHAVEIDAQRGGGVLAERERTEGAGVGREQQPARDEERRGDDDVVAAAVLERAEQPEGDFERGIGIGREIEDERGHGAGEARERESRQQRHGEARAAAGDGDEAADRHQRAGDAGERHGERSGARERRRRS